MDPQAPETWLAALKSEYVRDGWSPWAERVIAENPGAAESWLQSVLEAKTASEAAAGFARALPGDAEALDKTALELGFLYLRHLRGDLVLAELLQRSGVTADSASYDAPHAEEFYLLLKEIDGGGPAGLSSEQLTIHVRQLFEPFELLARRCSTHIAV